MAQAAKAKREGPQIGAEDFEVFGHIERGKAVWIPGAKIITDFRMDIEKAVITVGVGEGGFLCISPDNGGGVGFVCEGGRWRYTTHFLKRTVGYDTHPERREGEVCIGNVLGDETTEPFLIMDWKTKRLGTQAYWAGDPVPTKLLRPLFVQKTEMEPSDQEA